MNKLFLVCMLITSSLQAQVAARLSGTVVDTSSGVVGLAKITALNQNTGTPRVATAGADGEFQFPSLEPGKYRLSAEAAGFAVKVIEQYELTVTEQASIVIKLELAGTNSAVEVKSGEESARVQTADAQISRVITMQEIEGLPLSGSGRDPIELAYYQPGIVYGVTNNASGSVLNGTRRTSTNTMVDGIASGDPVSPRMGLTSIQNNTDSIAEFRIVTSGGKAEYGRNSGAQIEMATRSGSNRWSGNVFDYLRNTVLNANDYFNNLTGLSRPKLIQNVFGGSLGGPVLKNKTFFFANYQGASVRQGSAVNSTVLTDTGARGIFQWKAPGTQTVNSFDIVANDPRHLGVDPLVAKYLSLLPKPNFPALGDGLNTSGFRFNSPLSTVSNAGVLKLDHNLTDLHHLYFRYDNSYYVLTDAGNGAQARYPGQNPGTQFAPFTGFSAGSDWVITPNLVNTVRVGRTNYDVTFERPQRGTEPALSGLLFTSPVSTAFPSGRRVPLMDMSETLTWVHGKHTVKGGFRYQPSTDSEWTDAGRYPTIGLNPALASTIGPAAISATDRNTFSQLYNNLLGRVATVTQTFYTNDLTNYLPAGAQRRRERRSKDMSFYVQDDWRLSRRLTMNYGMRWDYFGLPQLNGAKVGHLDQEALADGVTPVDNFKIVVGEGAGRSDKRGFAPRIGLAWVPFGDGKTVIRAAWGIYFDRIPSFDFTNADGNPGVSNIGTVPLNAQAGSDYRLADGVPAVPVPTAVNLTLPVNQKGNFFMYSPHLRQPYVQQMNFTLERQVARQTVVDVAYVGSRGVQLITQVDYTEPHFPAGFLDSFREMQGYQANGTAPSSGNVFVKAFGTPAAALSGMNGTYVQQGQAGLVSYNLYRNSLARFTAAGFPGTYLGQYPQFADLYVMRNDGRSYYNSLQISVRRSVGSLRLSANYTWSKNIDNLPATDLNANTFGYQDPRATRGLSDTNVPRNFTTTAVFSLPVGRGKRFGSQLPGLVDAIVGGWDLGAVNVLQDGFPFSVGTSYLTSTVLASAGNRADVNGEAPAGQAIRGGNGVSFFTPQQAGLFTIPAAGSTGTSARNGFRGPAYWNTNGSLTKRFAVTERARMLLRVEGFNVFNRVSFAGPNSVMTNAAFGRITGTNSTARAMQVALRLDF